MAAPLEGILQLMMRGNAESQAQAQVKEVASKQADSTSKLQVTMTADPNDPGNPHITVKNAKADLLNQTQGQDLQNAYDAPHKNVETEIARRGGTAAPAPQPTSGMDPGQFEGAALRSVGYPPERTDRTAADLQSYGQDFRAQRDLGEPIIKAAIKAAIMKTGAWSKDKIAEELDRNAAMRNAGAFQHAVSPILQEQDRMAQTGNTRFGQVLQFNKQYLDTRDKLLDQKNTMNYGSLDSYLNDVAAALAPVGGIRPGDENLFARAFQSNRVSFLGDRAKALSGPTGKEVIPMYRADEAPRFIQEQLGVDPDSLTQSERGRAIALFNGLQNEHIDNKLAEIRKDRDALGSFPTLQAAQTALGLTDLKGEKLGQFTADWQTANKSYATATALKKAELDRKGQEIQLGYMKIAMEKQQLDTQQQLARLNTPEAVQQSINSVLEDGNQLYALPDKTPLEKAYKAKVEASVRAATGGRLPIQIKPGSEDDKRVTVIAQGLNDVNNIEHLYDKWAPVAPLGGPALAALNKAIIQNKPTSYLARLAMDVVPGYSSLPPQKQQEYLTDAATMAHRVNALTGRETRAVAGGRFAVQLFDLYAGTTPGFQSSATFKGLIAGARQEFANAATAIRDKQWGGHPPPLPGTTPPPKTAPTGGTVSLDDALATINKKP